MSAGSSTVWVAGAPDRHPLAREASPAEAGLTLTQHGSAGGRRGGSRTSAVVTTGRASVSPVS